MGTNSISEHHIYPIKVANCVAKYVCGGKIKNLQQHDLALQLSLSLYSDVTDYFDNVFSF